MSYPNSQNLDQVCDLILKPINQPEVVTTELVSIISSHQLSDEKRPYI